MTTKNARDMTGDEWRQARADLLRGGPVRIRPERQPVLAMPQAEYAAARARLIGPAALGAEDRQTILKMTNEQYEAAKTALFRECAAAAKE